MKKKTLVILISMVILAVLVSFVSTDEPNDNSTQFINDSNAYISVTPAVIRSSQHVEFEIQSKAYTGNIDIAFGFNTSQAKPETAELYNPMDYNVTQSYTCDPPYFYNYTISPMHLWCWQNISGQNELNESITETVLVYEHDFEEYNLSINTIYWNELQHKDWWSIGGMFTKVNHEYDGKDTWYVRQNQPVTAGTMYAIRSYIKVPVCFANDPDCVSYGKYDIAIKPSSLSMPEAIAQNKFYFLDPWWNSTWQKRVQINLTDNNNTERLNEPVVINFSNIETQDCNAEGRIMYNDTTDEWVEIASQVLDGDNATWCQVAFLANVSVGTSNQRYFYYIHAYDVAIPTYVNTGEWGVSSSLKQMANAIINTTFKDANYANSMDDIYFNENYWRETNGAQHGTIWLGSAPYIANSVAAHTVYDGPVAKKLIVNSSSTVYQEYTIYYDFPCIMETYGAPTQDYHISYYAPEAGGLEAHPTIMGLKNGTVASNIDGVLGSSETGMMYYGNSTFAYGGWGAILWNESADANMTKVQIEAHSPVGEEPYDMYIGGSSNRGLEAETTTPIWYCLIDNTTPMTDVNAGLAEITPYYYMLNSPLGAEVMLEEESDINPPVITTVNPEDGITYPSSSIDLNWSANEGLSWAAYSLDGGENITSIFLNGREITFLGSISGAGAPNFLYGAYSVYVIGEVAYVTSEGDDALTIFNISNPTNPQFLGAINGSGEPNFLDEPYSVYVIGEVAYVASQMDNALTTLNISNPTNPQFLGAINGSGEPNFLNGARSVYVIGEVAYVASYVDDTLSTFNISDPASPQHLGNISGAGAPNFLDGAISVYVSGEAAYVASYLDDALSTFNISDPTSPQLLGSINGASEPNFLDGASSVSVSGEVAYVASYLANALTTFNISDPISPQHLGNISGAGAPYFLDYAISVFVSDDVAYVASYINDAISTFNIFDPTSPQHLDSINGTSDPNSLDGANSIYVVGEMAYVASRNDYALSIFNVSKIATNITLSSVSNGIHTLQIFANDSWGNMGNSSLVDFIIDISPPAYSNQIANNTTPRTNEDIELNTTWSEDGALAGWMLTHNATDGDLANETFNATFGGFNESTFVVTTNLTEGMSFEYGFWANDTSGNVNWTGLQSITISNTEPSIALIDPPEGNYTQNPQPNFEFTYTDIDESNGICTLYINTSSSNPDENYSVDSTVVSDAITTLTIDNGSYLPDGDYWWNINCSDGTVEVNSSWMNITIDTIAPEISNLVPESENHTTTELVVNFMFNVTEINLDTCKIFFNDDEFNNTNTSGVFSTAKSTGLGTGETGSWYASCIDMTGNMTNSSIRYIYKTIVESGGGGSGGGGVEILTITSPENLTLGSAFLDTFVFNAHFIPGEKILKEYYVQSNAVVTNCSVTGPFYCNASENKVKIGRDYTNQTRMYIYDKGSLTVFSGITAKTIPIYMRFVNLAYYLPFPVYRTLTKWTNFPYIFRIENGLLVGIFLLPLLILTAGIFILKRSRKIRKTKKARRHIK